MILSIGFEIYSLVYNLRWRNEFWGNFRVLWENSVMEVDFPWASQNAINRAEAFLNFISTNPLPNQPTWHRTRMALARKFFRIPSIANAWAGSIRRKFQIFPIGLQQSSLNGVGVFPSSSDAFTRPWRQTSPGHLTASVTVTKCNEYHIIETKTQNSGIQWLE